MAKKNYDVTLTITCVEADSEEEAMEVARELAITRGRAEAKEIE